MSYSKIVKEGRYTTAVAKAVLDLKKGSLVSLRDIFVAIPASGKTHHYGSRIVMDKKGHLFISVGDRGDRHKSQSLKTHMGKIVRIDSEGNVPKDNPFVGREGALKEIWSFGHRNPQGTSFDPFSGELYEQEHGPRGGDEINRVERGANYGWPSLLMVKSTGAFYREGSKKKGMKQPLKYWVPSIAPCGLAVYSGKKFPKWKGNLFSGALGEAI